MYDPLSISHTGIRRPQSGPEISLDVSPNASVRSEAALSAWLREHGVEEVECVAPDFAGIGRGKVMPAGKFAQFRPIYLPTSLFFLTITGDYPDLTDFSAYDIDADLELRPDLSTTRAVPWANDRSVQVIHDVTDREGNLVGFAPRSVLRRVLGLYAERGWRPVVAPEMEFYLTKPNTDPDYPLEPPVGRSGRRAQKAQAYSIAAVDEYDVIVEHIYDYADALGLDIDTVIQEGGAAQLEINLRHGDPLDLADQVFFFKRLIREAALRCGCYATFMAKPMEGQPGSAMHIHQSIVSEETGLSLFSAPDGAPSAQFFNFIGGQQAYFRAACCLVAPYVNSYRRLVPQLTAPINLDWGRDNRTTGLRVPISEPEARRVENRVVGADANPYLAIAATLACGYLGMVEGLSPRPEVTTDSYDRPRELPYSLLDAVAEFRAQPALREVLGPEFCALYATVKEHEYDEFMRVISPWEREHLLLNV
ncbi:glutamine synthetase family protein [Paralimibaculum aggregatum]|uniref:Glutamine synthetase family protein n=1 Tax=Paralimibaculum aggregatum TaxID=3036245 RepID=A0ABQ6LJE9_9RHOB|nr:glutamine synthetase family protein [Limibaculum sp. NKW23]GMG81328.1 glutamine synthetase family protein [Limibaculum sp. NKW23]